MYDRGTAGLKDLDGLCAWYMSRISKYIPTDGLTFGNLFAGSDWADPVYTLD